MIDKMIGGYLSQLTAIRHDIHRHPELGFEEFRTSDLVADYLSAWGYEVHRGLAGTGVVGTLRQGCGEKRLGLRADMDALPITENNGKPWSSRIANRMHACGHDGHTTMLLGAARYLAQTRNFNGTLHLIFQPAEEMLNGGARMLEQGLFELFPCDAIFAMHNMPGMPAGEFFFQHGPFMASMDQFNISVQGRGGHGAIPHLAVDPVLVASHITVALQSIVSRNINPLEAAVITVGSIKAGEAANVIPESAEMKLSVRSLDPQARATLLARIPALVQAQAESFGACARVEHVNGTPVLMNDEAMTRFAHRVAEQQFGTARAHYGTQPLMGSEDFAFMLDAHPQGCYLIIGNGKGEGSCMVHNPGYDFNDDCLAAGSHYWGALTEAYLK
ncbi:M20 aminoacylase family protein [Serratia sp. root2]|uniref:M20 aminoacylase family protein n=1 Tax=Serratia sp. root2 TaxID=3059676 RepID=UPI002891D09A|nr:M20 aminoacylase family protein [Serratia sp. root2]MDT3250193.1 M20 aminoacylase family protein [Serratia sp. root2]